MMGHFFLCLRTRSICIRKRCVMERKLIVPCSHQPSLIQRARVRVCRVGCRSCAVARAVHYLATHSTIDSVMRPGVGHGQLTSAQIYCHRVPVSGPPSPARQLVKLFKHSVCWMRRDTLVISDLLLAFSPMLFIRDVSSSDRPLHCMAFSGDHPLSSQLLAPCCRRNAVISGYCCIWVLILHETGT